ncbi:MAG: hypothetical protein HQL52_00900 [Magnetococcales bacterium]|nr:hypothetical protein [Magnetococcales bacterium]
MTSQGADDCPQGKTKFSRKAGILLKVMQDLERFVPDTLDSRIHRNDGKSATAYVQFLIRFAIIEQNQHHSSTKSPASPIRANPSRHQPSVPTQTDQALAFDRTTIKISTGLAGKNRSWKNRLTGETIAENASQPQESGQKGSSESLGRFLTV